MPNRCDCDLFVWGEPEELQRFLNGLQYRNNDSFSILESYYPMPEEIANTESPVHVVEDEATKQAILAQAQPNEIFKAAPITQAEQADLLARYGVDNWYDWALRYWGSKWGDYNTVLEYNTGYSIKIRFDSAWRPPVEGLLEVAKRFPKLSFSLYGYETGLAYQMGVEYSDGQIVDQWTHDYCGDRGG